MKRQAWAKKKKTARQVWVVVVPTQVVLEGDFGEGRENGVIPAK